MTYAWREVGQSGEGKVFNAAWIIDAPWAHPVWKQYLVQLYDLTTPHDSGPVAVHLPGATHEFMIHALNPDYPIEKDAPIGSQQFRPLHPANYGYQIKAESDDAALNRVQELVDGIVAEKLSPDTDFRSLWDMLLADCRPLVRSA